MEFSYDEYYGVLVRGSLIFIYISIVVLAIGLVRYFYNKKSKADSDLLRHNLLITIFSFVALNVLALITMNTNLLFEKDTDKLTTCGIITEIDNVSKSAKLNYNNMQVTPSLIVINNNEYYIMYIGDYSIGDNVTIEYLPNSMIVLSIHDVE